MNIKMLTMGAMALAMMTGAAVAGSATGTSALDDPAAVKRSAWLVSADAFMIHHFGRLDGPEPVGEIAWRPGPQHAAVDQAESRSRPADPLQPDALRIFDAIKAS